MISPGAPELSGLSGRVISHFKVVGVLGGWAWSMAGDPTYKPLYGEPRFRALLKRIGLPAS